jgi:RNA polymerase sigma-B factor
MHRQDSDRLKETRRSLVLDHLSLADAIAHRYLGRRQDADDLRQVAYVGLVKAVARFDPERTEEFASFAVPTIAGEIKRHFRDDSWFVRPPRSLQELRSAVAKESPRLAQQLGREPTSAELAGCLGQSERRVEEAVDCGGAMHPVSLDAPLASEGERGTFADMLPSSDGTLEQAERVQALRAACRALAPRERLIIFRRFYEERTQSEIAREIGVTQMQVSRLLVSTLARLRELLREQPVAA